ncbi:hypothetical protein ACQPXS_23600 [Streptomyces sp. CA-142005]|uniref:hypothetical protein n=1 Tax=Streptomyces sp. CA-142005 TaxID=3240052 RepID=UPI003D8DD213
MTTTPEDLIAHYGPEPITSEGGLFRRTWESSRSSLPGMTAAEWRTVVGTGLTSVFACPQATAAHMRARGGGTLTHIASIEPPVPRPYAAGLADPVSKAAGLSVR